MTGGIGDTVLALYPTSRGFGFVLFEGSERLIDWGVKEVRWKDKNFLSLHGMKVLIERYSPDIVVIEDTSPKKSRRHERIRILYRLLARHAESKGITVHRFTQGAMHEHFSVHTKYEMAEAVAAEIPVFAPRLPRKRKAWMSEDARQSLFDAAALALLYYSHVAGEPEAGA